MTLERIPFKLAQSGTRGQTISDTELLTAIPKEMAPRIKLTNGGEYSEFLLVDVVPGKEAELIRMVRELTRDSIVPA